MKHMELLVNPAGQDPRRYREIVRAYDSRYVVAQGGRVELTTAWASAVEAIKADLVEKTQKVAELQAECDQCTAEFEALRSYYLA